MSKYAGTSSSQLGSAGAATAGGVVGALLGGVAIGVAVGMAIAAVLLYRKRRTRPTIGGVRQSSLLAATTLQIHQPPLDPDDSSSLKCDYPSAPQYDNKMGMFVHSGCTLPPPAYNVCVLENSEAVDNCEHTI